MPKVRILVVDDNQTICELLRSRLQSQGYEVNIAMNGEEAITRAQLEKPDLILLDIIMPGTDGLQVARSLRGDKETKNIPIILVTARATDPNVRLAKVELGIEGYVIKPFMPDKLAEAIQQVIGEKYAGGTAAEA